MMGSVSVQSHLASQQPLAPMSGNNMVGQHQDPTKSIQWQISTSIAPASGSKVSNNFNIFSHFRPRKCEHRTCDKSFGRHKVKIKDKKRTILVTCEIQDEVHSLCDQIYVVVGSPKGVS